MHALEVSYIFTIRVHWYGAAWLIVNVSLVPDVLLAIFSNYLAFPGGDWNSELLHEGRIEPWATHERENPYGA